MSTEVTDDDRAKIARVRILLSEVSTIVRQLGVDSNVRIEQILNHEIPNKFPYPIFQVEASKVERF